MNWKEYFTAHAAILIALLVASTAGICHGEKTPPLPQRVLNLSSADDTREINSYFSTDAHGPTRKYFEFHSEKAVVETYINNKSLPLGPQIKVFLFALDTTPQSIAHWINNQHSDGIFVDAAKPLKTIQIKDRYVHSITRGPLPDDNSDSGSLYEKYEVTFYVQDFTAGEVTFEESNSSATVFINSAEDS